jgi:hypothetical protein
MIKFFYHIYPGEVRLTLLVLLLSFTLMHRQLSKDMESDPVLAKSACKTGQPLDVGAISGTGAISWPIAGTILGTVPAVTGAIPGAMATVS